MSRRSIVVAAVAGLITLSAHAAESTATADVAQPLATEERYDLRALFDKAPGVISDDANGITVGAFAVEVLVARRGPDGKLIKACVNSEEAAKQFLSAPIDRIATKKAKEQ
jgi:hypothetical protein